MMDTEVIGYLIEASCMYTLVWFQPVSDAVLQYSKPLVRLNLTRSTLPNSL